MTYYYKPIKMNPEEAVKHYAAKYPNKAASLKFEEMYNAVIDDELQLYSLSPNRDKIRKLDLVEYYRDHNMLKELKEEHLKRCQLMYPDEKLVYVNEFNLIASDAGKLYSPSRNYKEVYNNNFNNHGYVMCKTTTVHMIIAKAFGLYQPDKEVDHINGNKRDNRLCNLQMLTHKENMDKMIEYFGVHPCTGRIGSKHPRSKPVVQYSLDGVFIREWESQNLAATTLGMKQSEICNCVNGRTKSAKGYIWKRKEN